MYFYKLPKFSHPCQSDYRKMFEKGFLTGVDLFSPTITSQANLFYFNFKRTQVQLLTFLQIKVPACCLFISGWQCNPTGSQSETMDWSRRYLRPKLLHSPWNLRTQRSLSHHLDQTDRMSTGIWIYNQLFNRINRVSDILPDTRSKVHELIILPPEVVYYRLHTKYGEGNVFKGICLFTGVSASSQHASLVCRLIGLPPAPPPTPGNAYLFFFLTA